MLGRTNFVISHEEMVSRIVNSYQLQLASVFSDH